MATRVVRIRAEHAASAVEAAERAFAEDNPWGVFGAGIGPIRDGGRSTGVMTLRVYLPHLSVLRDQTLPDVTFEHEGQAYVVAPYPHPTGRALRPARADAVRVTWSLQAGASIAAGASAKHGARGAVGALLGTPKGDPTHLVTAGHLFAPTAKATPVWAWDLKGTPVRIGTLDIHLLARTPRKNALDVAIVKLNDQGRSLAKASREKHPYLAAVEPSPAAVTSAGVRVRMYAATRGCVTAHVDALSGAAWVRVDKTETWPLGYTVRSPILTAWSISRDGDSGGPLVMGDKRVAMLGTCIGEDSDHSFFQRLDVVLDELKRAWGRSYVIKG